jgi:hypothetical protein
MLNITPIHKNLHTKITFLGLEFEDLVAVLALALVLNLLAHFISTNAKVMGIPLNIFLEFIVPLLAIPFLMVFKYGKPRGYLRDLALSLISARAWCAIEKDSVLKVPYLREDDGREI